MNIIILYFALPILAYPASANEFKQSALWFLEGTAAVATVVGGITLTNHALGTKEPHPVGN